MDKKELFLNLDETTLDFAINRIDLQIQDMLTCIERFRASLEKIAAFSSGMVIALGASTGGCSFLSDITPCPLI